MHYIVLVSQFHTLASSPRATFMSGGCALNGTNVWHLVANAEVYELLPQTESFGVAARRRRRKKNHLHPFVEWEAVEE